MRPLHITWTLETPMVMGAHPLHLDALVAYALLEQTMRFEGLEGVRTGSETIRAIAQRALPLGRAERDGDWCWQASAIVPVGDPGQHALRFWTRKTDVYDVARRAENGELAGRYKFPLKPYTQKVDTVRGLFKQQFKFFPVRQVKQLQAWCIGDEAQLLDLLNPDSGYVTALGAKTRMGFGRVGRFEIVEDPRSSELWQRRVLPWPHDGAAPVRMAVRPPYWVPEHQVDAYVVPGVLF